MSFHFLSRMELMCFAMLPQLPVSNWTRSILTDILFPICSGFNFNVHENRWKWVRMTAIAFIQILQPFFLSLRIDRFARRRNWLFTLVQANCKSSKISLFSAYAACSEYWQIFLQFIHKSCCVVFSSEYNQCSFFINKPTMECRTP